MHLPLAAWRVGNNMDGTSVSGTVCENRTPVGSNAVFDLVSAISEAKWRQRRDDSVKVSG